MIGKRIVLMLSCLLALASTHFALAQSTTGTISGNVTDASGAGVPSAKVTATEVATNVTRSVQSAPDGSYSILFLPIGAYKVDVNAAGFKKFEQTGIVLDVNRNARADAACGGTDGNGGGEIRRGDGRNHRPIGADGERAGYRASPLVDRDVYSLLTLTAGVDFPGQPQPITSARPNSRR